MDPQIKESQEGQKQINEDKTFKKVCEYLEKKKINMKLLVHEASRTSEESSAIRNTPLEWGSKTMLINTQDKEKVLLVYRANRKISWKKLRKIPSVGKKAQMAVEEDVHKLGLKPGGVPPFPNLLGLKGIIDIKFKEVQEMAFNAGHKQKSIIMNTEDFPMEGCLIQDITED